jgi:hypothetical protein
LQHPKNNLFTLKKLILIENEKSVSREIRASSLLKGKVKVKSEKLATALTCK